MTERRRRLTSRPAPIILAGFIVVILIGTVLLMLPISTQSGEWTPFLTALFTSTSLTCVTGLMLMDVATYWSPFGQVVILLLMEVGGLGVVTIATGISLLFKRKVSLKQRWIMQESVALPQAGSILTHTRAIIKVSAIIQLAGAALLAVRFVPLFGWGYGLWVALFTSVSAFTGGAVDLMGTIEPSSSLTYFLDDAYLILVVSALIIVGGIGFLTWIDVRRHGLHFKEYTLQSKIVLSTTAALLAGAFLFFYLYEFSLPQWAWLTPRERLVAAWFQAVVPRTTGFNVVDMGLMSEAGVAVTIILMFIGCSPGSTCGGIKVTTVVVLAATARSVFLGKRHTECFGRRIPAKVQRGAIAVLTINLVLLGASTLLITCIDGIPLMEALFECASALSTTGLSLGATGELSAVGLVIIMMLMFFGRGGSLTMMYALVERENPNKAKYAQESVAVG